VKIAVVGCGALGSYYGARLSRSGEDVWFLLRSDYDAVKNRGVEIVSADETFVVHPHAVKRPEEIGPCDLVIIGLKATANDQFRTLLPALVGNTTAILTLQNGLGNEEQLAALFGPEKILGGLCFVCLNRVAPGKILHIAHGKIVMGEFLGPSKPRTHAIADAIRKSGVPCDVTENIQQAHWEKLVWNVPFNGLGVAGAAGYDAVISGSLKPGQMIGSCLTTDILLDNDKWEKLVRELMMEVIHAAQALGLNVPEAAAETQINRTRDMGAYKASTLIDFERGLPLEIESLFNEPLRQAAKAGIASPRLKYLCNVLENLDKIRPGIKSNIPH
jgi:2-dehydropantoate 2-reductase